MKQEYYINFEGNNWTNNELARTTNVPSLIYGSAPTWELHFVQSNGEGGSIGANLSGAQYWTACVDNDFSQSTAPMILIPSSDIDSTLAADGIIAVELDTETQQFLSKVDGKAQLPAYFEIRGFDENDKAAYCWQLKINALGSIFPSGGN